MVDPQDSSAEHSFVREFCEPFLLGTQNRDGGWGFETNSDSRVEPSCWAIRTLQNCAIPVSSEALKSGVDYLLQAQLKDGSWPAHAGGAGSWVTSLACSILAPEKEYQREVRAAVEWLCNDYPRDSTLWRRMLQKFRSGEPVATHDDSLRGWGWTPHTSSWVEPTAFAMQALRDCPSAWRPAESAARLDLATGLLYDRMCPGGGWNCGNPMVYGVAGEPLVLPTGWALLALRDCPDGERKSQSLNWLSNHFSNISSVASLAVARITLESYGRELPRSHCTLHEMFDARALSTSTEVVAWTCLALSPKRHWFPKTEMAN